MDAGGSLLANSSQRHLLTLSFLQCNSQLSLLGLLSWNTKCSRGCILTDNGAQTPVLRIPALFGAGNAANLALQAQPAYAFQERMGLQVGEVPSSLNSSG